MKVNNKLLEKGVPIAQRKGWKFTLLSTPYSKLTFDNYEHKFKRKIGNAVFDVVLCEYAKSLTTKAGIKIELAFTEKRRHVKSGVVELRNGIVMLLSVGRFGFGCGSADLVLSSTVLHKESTIVIDNFKIAYIY
jgi:hypothetical protein